MSEKVTLAKISVYGGAAAPSSFVFGGGRATVEGVKGSIAKTVNRLSRMRPRIEKWHTLNEIGWHLPVDTQTPTDTDSDTAGKGVKTSMYREVLCVWIFVCLGYDTSLQKIVRYR